MAKRNYKIQELDDLVGGIDFDSSPFDVPSECLISGANILPSTVVGGITQRNGITKHNSVQIQESSIPKTFVGLFSYNWFGTEYFLAQAGTKFYNNTPDGTWANITGALSLTDSGVNLTSMDDLNGSVFCCNRSLDAPWYWNRTGNAAVISNPPLGWGTILCAYSQRMWMGGNNTAPDLLYFSALTDGTDYTGATDGLTGENFLNFDEGQGQGITGLARGNFGTLVVFKQKSISFVEQTGTTPPFYKYLFADGVGCVSQQSIVYLPGGVLIWWDNDDIYTLVGNQVRSATVHPKTKKPRLRNFFRNKVNQARLKYVTGAYYPALDIVRFFFSSPSSNVNDSHIDFHVKTQSWWGPGTLRGTSCCQRIVSGQSRLYAGDTNGFGYQHDNGYTDDGLSIAWNAQVPWQAFEGVGIRKKMDLLYAIINSQSNYNILADIYIDQSQVASISNYPLSSGSLGPPVFGTGTWGTSAFPIEGSTIESSMPINLLCKTVSANIHGNNSDVPVNIYKLLFTERALEFTRGIG